MFQRVRVQLVALFLAIKAIIMISVEAQERASFQTGSAIAVGIETCGAFFLS